MATGTDDELGGTPAWRVFRGNYKLAAKILTTEPRVFGGYCWMWFVAGRKFCCSFRGPSDGAESLRALRALGDHIRGFLPESAKNSGSVEGPCCVPEGGDIPKPLPPEESDG